MVDPGLEAALRTWLLPGERLLWTGRPQRGVVLQPVDLYIAPFALVWSGALVAIAVADPVFRNSPVALLFLIGAIYLIAGRFAVDAWARRRLIYAVSDRRAIILRCTRKPRLRSTELRLLPILELHERSGGRGTINFEAPPPDGQSTGRFWMDWSPAASNDSRFLDIEQARAVYDLIARGRLRQQPFAPPPPASVAVTG